MGQVSRRHHFVPKFYLARFTDTGTSDGRVWVLDPRAGRPFLERPKNIAWERDFNRVDVAGQAPDVLEGM